MKPIKLKMQAFGPYVKPVELDFDKGLNGQKFFLIHGATGAGKTTILDAICYALYNESSGHDKKIENLRSELVTDEKNTEVEFIFKLGEKIYKIRRNPGHKMPKGKGDVKKSAELYIDDKFISSDAREIDEKIKEEIGFNAEQFRQVVVLPQGKFRDFLMATSDKKMGILNLIFNSALYAKIEQILKEKFNAAETEKNNLENRRREILSQAQEIGKIDGDFDEKNLPDLINRISAEFQDAKKNLEELKIQSEKAQNNFTAGKILNEQFNSFEVAEKNFLAAKNDLEKISADFEKSRIEYEKRKAEESQRKELEKKIEELQKNKNSLAELQNKKSELAKAEEDEKNSRDEILKFEKRQKNYEERLNFLKAEIDSLEGAEGKFKDAEQNLKKSQEKLERLLELERLKKELANSQKRLAFAEKNYNDALKDLERLKLLQKMCTAASLAKNLSDGEPCPVCGATTHPNLAVTDEIIPTDEEIESSENFLKKKEIEKLATFRAVDAIKEKINLHRGEIKKFDDAPDFDAAKKIFDEMKINFDKLVEDRKNQKKGEELTEKNSADLKRAKDNFSVCEKKSATLRGVVETMQKQIAEKYLDNPQKISADLQENLNAKKILDDAWKNADENFHKIDRLKSNQEGKIKSAENAKNDAAKKIDGKIKPDIDSLKNLADDTKNFYTEGVKKNITLENNLKSLQEISAKLDNLKKILATAEKNFQIWSRLYEVANGKNPAKMTFQTYYLNAMFQDVIREANERLEKMSGGRYQFQEGVKKNARKTGLDLEIFDAYTSKARPVETLSGGETFLASLSLALGLAAVVKNSAGGINLDTIFIDEGFGSLDSETLDFAINTLTDLQQDGGRLIGIISHVEELKQRIPARLEVIKNKFGSTARFA